MKLQTRRLLLRPWEDGDAEILYRWAKDPEVGPMAGWKPHESTAESLAIIHGPLGMPETYALVLRETGEPVGSRTLSRRLPLGLSPASIRNVMADLEEAAAGGARLIVTPEMKASQNCLISWITLNLPE